MVLNIPKLTNASDFKETLSVFGFKSIPSASGMGSVPID